MTALTPRLMIGGAFLSLAALGLTGCGHGGSAASSAASSSATSSSSAAWTRPDAPPDPHTLLSAGAAALATVPHGTLIFIQSETDDAGTWKVQAATADGSAQQVKIGVDGIAVLVGPTPLNDSAADKAGRRAELQGAKLDYRAAVDKMLAAVPDGSITELKLAGSGDATVWQADVWDTYLVEHKVTVNAVSGAVEANKQN